MIKVTIRNNDNYADVEFPCSDSYLYSRLAEIHTENPNYTTAFVSAVIEPRELSCLKDHFINLDELNYLAKRMDSFFGDEETQFYEALKLEHFTELKDLINLTFNLNKYTLITDVSDMSKVGREYLLNRTGGIPAHDEDNPKYAEIGRQLLNSGRGVFTEHGLLFPDRDMKFEEVYNGQTFPAYLYDACLLVGEIEYEGKTEYVYLPEDDMAIEKAIKRLGADSIGDCSFMLTDFSADHKNMFDLFKSILDNEDIYEVNRLAKAVNQFVDLQDLSKLSAVLEFADTSTAKSIIALAENLDSFEYVKDISENEELGRWYIEHENHLDLSLDLEDYFDFDAYGGDLDEDLSGEFLAGGGYIYLKYGYCLEDILDTDEKEIMTMGGCNI